MRYNQGSVLEWNETWIPVPTPEYKFLIFFVMMSGFFSILTNFYFQAIRLFGIFFYFWRFLFRRFFGIFRVFHPRLFEKIALNWDFFREMVFLTKSYLCLKFYKNPKNSLSNRKCIMQRFEKVRFEVGKKFRIQSVVPIKSHPGVGFEPTGVIFDIDLKINLII